MKIQCDVCGKDEALVFCTADEAALCAACDHRVHHANKLAGKHHRFSLHHPSPKQLPLCDICQEKRAFLFCQQDRAILCQECDVQIHKANEHTQKHTRFLLTGVKLSATCDASPSSAESTSSSFNINTANSDAVPSIKSQDSKNNDSVSIGPVSTSSAAKSTTVQSGGVAAPAESSCDKSNYDQLTNEVNFNGQISASSISEYLIDTLPGWRFEDFLDSASPSLFYKDGENDGLPFWNGDAENTMSAFPSERMGLRVPHAPSPLHQTQQNQSLNISFGASNDQLKEYSKKEQIATNYLKSTRKRNGDNSFTVPQIFPLPTAFKRSRTLW